MSVLGETLRALAEAFDEQGVDWYLFGAHAVAIRGAPRATQDVDVTVQVPRTALPALIAALERHGLRHRYPELAAELIAHGSVLPLAASSGMEVDMVLSGSGLEQLALERATTVPIEGIPVPVVHATDLVVMKILAGRGKDIDDARAVIAAGEVDSREARELLRQLEHALGQSDLVPQLEALLAEGQG